MKFILYYLSLMSVPFMKWYAFFNLPILFTERIFYWLKLERKKHRLV